MKKYIVFAITVLVLTALACGFNVSTANISEAKTAKDADGNQPTTTFDQGDTFYLVVQLANAPDDTKVKAVWTAVEADGVEPNFSLGEKELAGSGVVNFSLNNENLWPVGKYKVDLYLNGELDRTLEFEVEGNVVAEEPTATATPEPTATPVVEATATPTSEPTKPPQASTGDSLQVEPAAEPTETPAAKEFEPLPFKDEPYVHPSGAFTFALPESFEGINDDETSAAFGDDRSLVGAVFVDAGAVYSDEQMKTFMDKATEIILGPFADDYEILGNDKVQPDDSIYREVSYTSTNGDGYADFFFEQRETVVFVLYFVTVAYDEMLPTWNEIIASYSVDPQAALAAAPAATPAPPPTPTSPPQPAGPSAPEGKGLFIFNNTTGVDFVVDVIGPTNDSQLIPPQSSKQFVLDPGHYTINGHSPGGEYVINAYEFDIAAGQVFPLNLN